MNIYRNSRSVADDLRDLMVVHQRFRTSTSPESVYILFGTRRTDGFTTVESLAAVDNTHPDPVSGFEVRRRDLEHVQEAFPEKEVVGVIHTHEDRQAPRPSAEDMAGVRDDHLHGILCPFHSALVFYDEDGTVRRFTPTRGKHPEFEDDDGHTLTTTAIITEGHETT